MRFGVPYGREWELEVMGVEMEEKRRGKEISSSISSGEREGVSLGGFVV